MWQTKRPQLEALQRLRRTSHQVWKRSRWRSAIARFRRLLLLRIGKREILQDMSKDEKKWRVDRDIPYEDTLV